MIAMELTEKSAQLYGLLFTKSFDLNALKNALQTGSFSNGAAESPRTEI